jgi:hypothetical protein
MAVGVIFVGHSASTDGGRIAWCADKLCGVQRFGAAAIAVVSCRCVGDECASAEFIAEEAVDNSARRVRGYILVKWVGLQTRIRLEGWALSVF